MIPFCPPEHPWQALFAHLFQLGESPRAAHGQLRWVDIQAKTLHRIKIDTLFNSSASPAFDTWQLPDQVGCVVPTDDPAIWVGCGREGIWHLSDDGEHRKIIDAPFDSTWQRFNDGCVDEWGRLWVSSLIDDKRAPLAGVWCLAQDRLYPVFTGLTTGNGMAYSAAHRKLWLADTTARSIHRYDVSDQAFTLQADGWVYHYTEGKQRPDGACMLDSDHYAVAVIEGRRLDVFNIASAQPVSAIPVPLEKPTMPCIIAEPACTLVLTSAAVPSGTAVATDASLHLYDGQILARVIHNCATPTFLYRLDRHNRMK